MRLIINSHHQKQSSKVIIINSLFIFCQNLEKHLVKERQRIARWCGARTDPDFFFRHRPGPGFTQRRCNAIGLGDLVKTTYRWRDGGVQICGNCKFHSHDGSMRRTVYLPTGMVDFYGKCVHGSCGI